MPKNNSKAETDIVAERKRQQEVEYWTAEHDDEHEPGVLAQAGACYALHAFDKLKGREMPEKWPWSPSWWKPKSTRRDLVRAAALIRAEIEKLDRADDKKKAAKV